MTGLDIGSTLAGLAVLLIGVLAAWVTGNAKGKASAKIEAAEQRTKDNEAIAAEIVLKNQSAIVEQTKTTVEANEIDEAVSRMSDADVLNELRNGSRTATADNKDNHKK